MFGWVVEREKRGESELRYLRRRLFIVHEETRLKQGQRNMSTETHSLVRKANDFSESLGPDLFNN